MAKVKISFEDNEYEVESSLFESIASKIFEGLRGQLMYYAEPTESLNHYQTREKVLTILKNIEALDEICEAVEHAEANE